MGRGVFLCCCGVAIVVAANGTDGYVVVVTCVTLCDICCDVFGLSCCCWLCWYGLVYVLLLLVCVVVALVLVIFAVVVG